MTKRSPLVDVLGPSLPTGETREHLLCERGRLLSRKVFPVMVGGLLREEHKIDTKIQ